MCYRHRYSLVHAPFAICSYTRLFTKLQGFLDRLLSKLFIANVIDFHQWESSAKAIPAKLPLSGGGRNKLCLVVEVKSFVGSAHFLNELGTHCC